MIASAVRRRRGSWRLHRCGPAREALAAQHGRCARGRGSAAPGFTASCTTQGHGGCQCGSTRERAAVARRVGAALARVALLLCLCSAAAEARSWTAAALRARALLDDAGEGGTMASRELNWSYIWTCTSRNRKNIRSLKTL